MYMKTDNKKAILGTCFTCNKQNISKAIMFKHIKTCLKNGETSGGKEPKSKEANAFLLRITDVYMKEYFLCILLPFTSTLNSLDTFLRNEWVECCGHMSEFNVGSKAKKASQILEKGMEFGYDYDFGSTTSLNIEVLDEAYTKSKKVICIGRNEPLQYVCKVCKKEAIQLCIECGWDEKSDEDFVFYCDACGEEKKGGHEHEEGMMLPIVNSPRMGVCAYVG